MYYKGQGIPDEKPDYESAIPLYQQAITLGNSSAMNNLAYMYYKGQGMPDEKPDYESAIPLYKQAIALGNSSAMNNLAYMYYEGQGTPGGEPNYESAIRLYQQAIDLGDTSAMCNRAYMYQHGQGTSGNKPDYPPAIMLLDKAIALGFAPAREFRESMESENQGNTVGDVLKLFNLVWDQLVNSIFVPSEGTMKLFKTHHKIISKAIIDKIKIITDRKDCNQLRKIISEENQVRKLLNILAEENPDILDQVSEHIREVEKVRTVSDPLPQVSFFRDAPKVVGPQVENDDKEAQKEVNNSL
jgi:tetratricopeptide (TPR) repeat protein